MMNMDTVVSGLHPNFNAEYERRMISPEYLPPFDTVFGNTGKVKKRNEKHFEDDLFEV